MIAPVWRLISLILALGVFLAVGIATLVASEELIWVVGKALMAFLVSWIVLGNLGNALIAMLEKQDADAAGQAASGSEKRS